MATKSMDLGHVTWNDSVRYDAAQSLTDDQKTQARDNINAAPGGFGLGGEVVNAPLQENENLTDANLINATGFYRAMKNIPDDVLRHYVIHLQYNKMTALQFSATTSDGTYALREKTNNGWGEWAYINPPMYPGVEYRITEWHLGKPVYTQIVQFDNLSTIQSFSPGGEIFRAIGEYQYPDTSREYVPNMPTRILGETMTMDSPYMDFSDNYNRTLRVQLKSDSKCLGKSARVQIWYTK